MHSGFVGRLRAGLVLCHILAVLDVSCALRPGLLPTRPAKCRTGGSVRREGQGSRREGREVAGRLIGLRISQPTTRNTRAGDDASTSDLMVVESIEEAGPGSKVGLTIISVSPVA